MKGKRRITLSPAAILATAFVAPEPDIPLTEELQNIKKMCLEYLGDMRNGWYFLGVAWKAVVEQEYWKKAGFKSAASFWVTHIPAEADLRTVQRYARVVEHMGPAHAEPYSLRELELYFQYCDLRGIQIPYGDPGQRPITWERNGKTIERLFAQCSTKDLEEAVAWAHGTPKSPKGKSTPTEADLPELLKQAMDFVRPRLASVVHDPQFKFEARMEGGLPRVLVDAKADDLVPVCDEIEQGFEDFASRLGPPKAARR